MCDLIVWENTNVVHFLLRNRTQMNTVCISCDFCFSSTHLAVTALLDIFTTVEYFEEVTLDETDTDIIDNLKGESNTCSETQLEVGRGLFNSAL